MNGFDFLQQPEGRQADEMQLNKRPSNEGLFKN